MEGIVKRYLHQTLQSVHACPRRETPVRKGLSHCARPAGRHVPAHAPCGDGMLLVPPKEGFHISTLRTEGRRVSEMKQTEDVKTDRLENKNETDRHHKR